MLRQNFNHHNHHLNQTDLRLFMGLLQAFVIFIDLLDGDVHIIRRDVLIPFKIVDNAIRMLAAAAFPISLSSLILKIYVTLSV